MKYFINDFCMAIARFGADHLMTIMLVAFILGIFFKIFSYYLLKRQFFFSSAFETRAHRHLDQKYEESLGIKNFHKLVEYLLQKTFFELYSMRKKQLRKRRGDSSVAVLNSVFLIEKGAQTIIDDTLKQTRYHLEEKKQPDFKSIAKFVFLSNPYFSKLWGIIPISLIDSVLSILPALFVIGGIFGTFLGITQGLPALKTMDPSNVAASQETLSYFLQSMTFAMNSSVIGIFLSVLFTIVNTVFSLNANYTSLVDKYILSLELLWKDVNALAPKDELMLEMNASGPSKPDRRKP